MNIAEIRVLDEILAENKSGYFTPAQVRSILNEFFKRSKDGVDINMEKGTHHQDFKQFVRLLFYRALNNYDSMLLITGNKGLGKSSVLLSIGREWTNLLNEYSLRHGGKKFTYSPKRHISYTAEQVMKSIDVLQPFEPIGADESIRFATSEDWNKAQNKQLKKKLGQIRTKHHLFMLALPLKIQKVDKVYLASYVDYWIEMVERGRIAVFAPDKNPYSDSWNLKAFDKIGSVTEFTNPDSYVRKLKRHPNFWKEFRVPKPSKKLYARYLKVRESAVYSKDVENDSLSVREVRRHAFFVGLSSLLNKMGREVTIKDFSAMVVRDTHIKVTPAAYNDLLREAKEVVDKYGES